MQAKILFDGVPVRGPLPEAEIPAVSSDSGRVTPGGLFICLPGTRHDGHDFAAEALAGGAGWILAEHPVRDVPPGRTILTESTRAAESRLWYNLTGRPADGMKKIAVTGTAGKTTVASLLAAILRGAGHRVGLIATVGAAADGRPVSLGENGGSSVRGVPGAMTTPDPEFFFGAVRQMKDAGCGWLVYEASSQSLLYRKTSALTPDAAVFTNLYPEHLDCHGTMENYFRAKASLMEGVKRAVVNADDEWMARIPGLFPEADYLRCTADPAKTGCEVTASGIRSRGAEGIEYVWTSRRAAFRVTSPMAGRYSVTNTMLACAAAVLFGTDPDTVREAVSCFRGPAGRLERVETGPGGPLVFVDYAHTPDALRAVLAALREIGGGKRLTVVFGCGGDRDPIKRPEMARAAQEYAGFTVVTEDNSRGEDPDRIFSDILRGIDKTKPFVLIPDRKRAIRFALGQAAAGEIVLLAGKGHEKYEIRADGKHPFDEAAVVREFYRERGRPAIQNQSDQSGRIPEHRRGEDSNERRTEAENMDGS